MTDSANEWDSLFAPKDIPQPWRRLLLRLPGYDSLATAEGCRFSTCAALKVINFFSSCLRHVEGKVEGSRFVLKPWQTSWMANLFGWKMRTAKGEVVRRYRETFGYVARKNGKTPMVAGIALKVLRTDEEKGQQNYIAAGEREQAGMLFRQCKGMLGRCPELAAGCRIYGGGGAAGQSKSVVVEEDGSFLRVISADAETKHGGNTHLAIIDELHVQPNRDLVDVLRTSMASTNRRQPLLVYITTADFDRPSICNEIYEYACRVRDDLIKDVRFLPVIYEVPVADKWDDEANWHKANPNLGVSVSLEFLRAECQRAKETPAYEYTFRRLHLNQRTTTETKAVDLARWDACSGAIDLADLDGADCYAGLDLSSKQDLSAFVMVFPLADGKYAIVPRVYVPRETAEMKERRDRVPYRAWADAGMVNLTPGASQDYDFIREDILALRDRYNIRDVAVDPWNARQMATQLMASGLSVVEFRQGFASMSEPTKELLRLVVDGKLVHGGNEMLRWVAGNLQLEQDAAGNVKPSKAKSRERIDPLVAAIMGLGRALVSPSDHWYQPGALTS